MVPSKWTLLITAVIVVIFSDTSGIELDEKGEFISQNVNSTEEPENVEDFCIEVCGDEYGVLCHGDTTDRDNITCSCEDENETFDKTEKECRVDYCKAKCGSATCEGNRFVEDEVKCVCENVDEDFIKKEKKCKVNYCRKVCGNEDKVVCYGEEYTRKTEWDCRCDDEEYLFVKKRCQKTCLDNDDCHNEGTCVRVRHEKICKCKSGTYGDTCEFITDCETGKLKNCKEERGDCLYKEGKAVCQCDKKKKFYPQLGYCEVSCDNDSDCRGIRKCSIDGFCVCQDGLEGEDCSVVTECKELEENCTKIGTECIFDENNPGKGTCKCKGGYTYNRDRNECLDPYCYPTNPCKKAECRYDESVNTGYCYCSGKKYYNYRTKRCEDLPDKCLLKKTPCDENEMCIDGECSCKYPVKKGEECERNICTSNYCFPNARCSEYDGTCFCEERSYFSGNKCEYTKCSLEYFGKKCPCPLGTHRSEDGYCVPLKDEGEVCSKDCGYGICIEKRGKETCKCFSSIAELLSVPLQHFGEKCILKKKFCAGGLLQLDSMKCKCEGQYTQADDGITCRLKTCDDDDVKDECEWKGAECIMNWKGKGYSCQCRRDYVIGDDGKCTDICSIDKIIRTCAKEDQFCYISFSSKKNETGICTCPPTIKMINGKCSGIAENVYIIRNIPVLKKRYEIKHGINKVLLSADLTLSLEQTFDSSLFEYGYLHDYRITGDVIICSVWINLKAYPSKSELEKIKLIPKTFSDLCYDCDESAIVWPPNLILSYIGLREATIDKLEFCSNEVKDLLCGKGASCRDNRCTCEEGFKIVASSIRDMGGYEISRCEDIDECVLGISSCSENTMCVNTFGSYKCVCKEGFKKIETPYDPETDKNDCYDMCTPSPCKKGKCYLKGNSFDCKCEAGYGGSFCGRLDENFIHSKKETMAVGTALAVLALLLFILATAFLYYVIKLKGHKCQIIQLTHDLYSEDIGLHLRLLSLCTVTYKGNTSYVCYSFKFTSN